MNKPKNPYNIAFSPNSITEAFKGEVVLTQEEKRNLKGLSPHPFNGSEMQKIYDKFGIITAAVDKYVDFIVGPGFYVESKSEKAKQIIEDFNRDTNFDSVLRRWVKQGLVKFGSPLELGGGKNESIKGLNILNADYIYKRRDKKGELKEYVQKIKFNDEGTPFEPYQIAYLCFNIPDDAPYGLGIVYSNLNIINNVLGCEKDMHTLIRRKANSPLHVMLGNYDKDDIPTPEAIEAFGSKLEYMNNKQEWATGPNVTMTPINYGDVGGKFDFVLNHDMQSLLMGLQIPEVIMGKGNIPEGLAAVQLDTFMRRVQSFQAEIEKVIEQDIYKRVLNSQGIDEHVEFQWGQPSNTEVNERITKITELLKLFDLSKELRTVLEEELANLLELDVEIPSAEERRAEEDKQQPLVPGEQRQKPKVKAMLSEGVITKDKLLCGNCGKVSDAKEIVQLMKYECIHCGSINETNMIHIKEWLGFNYSAFLKNIEAFIKKDDYDLLKANTEIEVVAGKLSESQIKRLKNILITNFREGNTIKDIQADIRKEVGIKDLYKIEGDELKVDATGKPIVDKTVKQRIEMIARTETTRAAAEGALNNYKDNGIAQVRFLAAMSQRTCQTCESLNGKIMTVGEAQGIIPYGTHPYCRCTYIPIV